MPERDHQPNAILDAWHRLEAAAAAGEVLPCFGSKRWASELAAARPFEDPAAVFAAADSIWLSLAESDWDEAFASHPRIGERRAPASATAKSANWSTQEQSAVSSAGDDTQERLRLGNATYEARFGRTYIVCATGKTAEEMLRILEGRLNNHPETELREAVEQQRQIAQLRLRKWLGV